MARTQIIKCKCGVAFAACLEPLCYTDKDWLKSLKKYVLNGCIVDLIETGNGLYLEKCKCNQQLKLF